ncbi:hypothetical protein DPMN_019417 [Dreissena polymorpha]|uniref:Uncharacterized protein n=1 Tax=Dreissena polymorpha TaxID=45954 RepID=A0A9D4NJA0_DREPO|nr:hypothetical protein DPMN_019417 [Dreissena polymorpha]
MKHKYHHKVHKKKFAHPCLQSTGAIFKPYSATDHIHKTNVLIKFHDDWTKNLTSRETNVIKIGKTMCLIDCLHVFTIYIIEKTAPLPGGHVFEIYTTIFKLVQDIHKTNAKNVTSRVKKTPPPWRPCFLTDTNVLTKFHDDWTKNVTSRLFTCFHYQHIEKIAPLPGGHVFSPIWTIFELIQDINETNVSTKFHDDWAKIVTFRVFTRNTAPPPGGHVFQQTRTIFKLNQHIIKTNILTKYHEDRASNVTSTVFTNFELSRGIIGTNVLTKFHEDGTINVASRMFTRQNVDDGRTTDKRRSQKLTMSTLCSGCIRGYNMFKKNGEGVIMWVRGGYNMGCVRGGCNGGGGRGPKVGKVRDNIHARMKAL